MVGLGGLAEAVLGRNPVIDGLVVQPATPSQLAVQVTVGQIYGAATLDAQAYGSLDADTAHTIVKQGLQADPLVVPIQPPATPGYSQSFLLQAAFQERDTGAVVLPYYNSQNPAQAWAGPTNSGAQQYTMRQGAVVVQVKGGVPSPTGSQQRPSADPGWVPLAWVTVASGTAVVTATNIVQATGSHRILAKLPALSRAAGAAITLVSGARDLSMDDAGLVLLDLGAWTADQQIRLPPISGLPNVPMRFRICGRFITPRGSRRALSWGRIIASGTDTIEGGTPFVYCGPNDSVEFVSDGTSRWIWVGDRFASPFCVAANAQTIPNALPTVISLFPPGADIIPNWWTSTDPTAVRFVAYSRVRVTACVTFAYAPGGARQAYFHLNGQPQSGAGWPWQTTLGATGNLPASLSLAGGPTGVVDSDVLQLAVYQDSGGPLAIDSGKTWLGVEMLT